MCRHRLQHFIEYYDFKDLVLGLGDTFVLDIEMITKKAHISLTNRYDERVDFSIEAYSSYVNLRAMTVFCYHDQLQMVVEAMILFKRG